MDILIRTLVSEALNISDMKIVTTPILKKLDPCVRLVNSLPLYPNPLLEAALPNCSFYTFSAMKFPGL